MMEETSQIELDSNLIIALMKGDWFIVLLESLISQDVQMLRAVQNTIFRREEVNNQPTRPHSHTQW